MTPKRYRRMTCPACRTTCEHERVDGFELHGDSIVERAVWWCTDCRRYQIAPLPEPVAATAAWVRANNEAVRAAAASPEPYGCVNCRIAEPRQCAESGHRDCDALREDAP